MKNQIEFKSQMFFFFRSFRLLLLDLQQRWYRPYSFQPMTAATAQARKQRLILPPLANIIHEMQPHKVPGCLAIPWLHFFLHPFAIFLETVPRLWLVPFSSVEIAFLLHFLLLHFFVLRPIPSVASYSHFLMNRFDFLADC